MTAIKRCVITVCSFSTIMIYLFQTQNQVEAIKNWENKSFELFDQTQQTTLLKTAKYNIKSSLPSSIDRQMLHKPLNMFEEV